MSFTYRRNQLAQTGKGIGGFLKRPSKLRIGVESDSAMNMTMDTIQNNSLNKEPQEPETQKPEPKKRKVNTINNLPKKQKVDMTVFNQEKYMKAFYKKK